MRFRPTKLDRARCVLYANGMARRSELVAATARALKLEERTVRMCARHLREAGLIQQKGRGPSAAHMTPTDATNLLLGCLTSDVLQDAPRNVRQAREAMFRGTRQLYRHEPPPLPQAPFLLADNGQVRNVGEAIDALLDEAVRFGDPIVDHDELPIIDLAFRVRRPGLAAWFDVYNGDNSYTVYFEREDPRLDGLEGDEKFEAALQLVKDEGGMRIEAEVSLIDILLIADVLRGERYPEERD
jgi:hypothetical protein